VSRLRRDTTSPSSFSPFGREGYLRSRGEFFGPRNFRKNFYKKGMKKFSGRRKIQGEMIGHFGGKNHLRHTGVIKRGNVR
jgi:hypothetical protein